ncbi:hypothetical protein CEUSTIGMA_g4732.t1 [Chlamydomonas eustigma]|uniref:RING-type domain-containing protein n=1 Tax=Chlamydomonas eustigma TaxID=1157962 RepID=A0A250X2K8_9CHLO|nr:hypothetical protein CEUSTIGMA_g4732.t1 [Chlamydomonas eustigma]|eukprot:GAX77286.1 hypothetical protein CEUSTIGMA_g4732.t1 [Chlamydomonas eustigma]
MGNQNSIPEVRDLLSAIGNGDLNRASALLLRHPELFAATLDLERGHNAFHMAVILKQNSILHYMLSCAHASVDAHGSLEAKIMKFARKAMNQGRRGDQATPLMLACDIADDISLRLLLSAKVNPWCRDSPFNRTCLHYAAVKGHAFIINSVIRRTDSAASSQNPRPLVDACTVSGVTPLMYAAWFNHAEAIRALVHHGAKLRRRLVLYGEIHDPLMHVEEQAGGSTALHLAAINGSFEAAMAIVGEYMATIPPEQRRLDNETARLRRNDVRLLVDVSGRTAFSVARRLRRRNMMALLNPLTNWEAFVARQASLARAASPEELARKQAAKEAREALIQQVQDLRASVAEQRAQREAQRLAKKEVRMKPQRIASLRHASSPRSQHGSGASRGASAFDMTTNSPRRTTGSSALQLKASSSLRGGLFAVDESPAGGGRKMSRLSGAVAAQVLSPGQEASASTAAASTSVVNQTSQLGTARKDAAAITDGESLNDQKIQQQSKNCFVQSTSYDETLSDVPMALAPVSVSPFSKRDPEEGNKALEPVGVHHGSSPRVHSMAQLSCSMGALTSLRRMKSTYRTNSPASPRSPASRCWNRVESSLEQNASFSSGNTLGNKSSTSQILRQQSTLLQHVHERLNDTLVRRSGSFRNHLSPLKLQGEDGTAEEPAPMTAPTSGPSLAETSRAGNESQQQYVRRQLAPGTPSRLARVGAGWTAFPVDAVSGSEVEETQEVVASLAEVVDEDGLEDTLATYRIHRLIHGIGNNGDASDEAEQPACQDDEEGRALPSAQRGGLEPNELAASSDSLNPPPNELAASSDSLNPPPNFPPGSDPHQSITKRSELMAAERYESLQNSLKSASYKVPERSTSTGAAAFGGSGLMNTTGMSFSSSSMALVVGAPSTLALQVSRTDSVVSANTNTLSEGGDEYEDTCAVCFDEGDFVAIQECGHKICVDCALELLKVHPADEVPCPFCRGKISGFGHYHMVS